jgi:hypothetical protein
MSNIVYPGASVDVAVAASDVLALWSNGGYTVTEEVGYPNYPNSVDTIASSQGGSVTTAAFSAATTITINAGVFPVYYEVGTDAVVKATRGEVTQGAPNALNVTGALTSAMLLGGIITSTTAAGVAGTLPTGAVLDAASSWAVGDAFDFTVINTGANTFTVTAAATGHTVVGNMAVATGTTGRFRTRKTAAETFVTYSLAN